MQGGIRYTELCDVCRYVGKEVKNLVSHYLAFCLQGGFSMIIPIHRFFPWPNNSTAVELV